MARIKAEQFPTQYFCEYHLTVGSGHGQKHIGPYSFGASVSEGFAVSPKGLLFH